MIRSCPLKMPMCLTGPCPERAPCCSTAATSSGRTGRKTMQRRFGTGSGAATGPPRTAYVDDRMRPKESHGRDIEFKAEHGTLLRGWHYLPDQRTTHDGAYASEQSFFAYS